MGLLLKEHSGMPDYGNGAGLLGDHPGAAKCHQKTKSMLRETFRMMPHWRSAGRETQDRLQVGAANLQTAGSGCGDAGKRERPGTSRCAGGQTGCMQLGCRAYRKYHQVESSILVSRLHSDYPSDTRL